MRRSSAIAIETSRQPRGAYRSRRNHAGARPSRLEVELFASERADLLDRMHQLSAMLPSFAREADRARTQAARLRLENKRLLEQVRSLQVRIERDSATSRH
ncbi:MAG: hypothetical protein ACYCU0_05040 [Solirubrobacteraceae bacterium]